MTVLAIIVVMLMVWRRLTPSDGSFALAGLGRLASHAPLVRSAALMLIPLYAAQLALDVLRCRTENVVTHLAWMNALPLPVHDWRAPMTAATAAHRALSTVLALDIGCLETAALALVVAGLLQHPRVIGRRFLSLLAIAFALLSLLAPAMSTTDPYEFVAAGMLGWAAYAPPSGAFSGTAYATIAPHIPLVGVVYGPLWLLVDSVQTSLAGSLYAKLEALRAGNVLCLFATVILLAKNGVSRAVAAAFVLNPAVWYEGVANMHAEVLALVAFAAVYHFARRANAPLAALCLAAAGLIKLPFVLVGGVLLAPLDGRRRRIGWWIAAVALVVLVSWCSSEGNAYLGAVSHFAGAHRAGGWPRAWLVILPLLGGLTLQLALRRRAYFGAPLLFHLMLIAPWHILWGFPYALAAAGCELFLVAFPFAATQTGRDGSVCVQIIGVALVVLTFDVCASRYRAERRRLVA